MLILPGDKPNAPVLIDFGQVSSNLLSWTVNVTAGTSLRLNLRDQTGALAQSTPFTVIASSWLIYI
ncbi:hypothetical protein D9619_005067 [Psilocybe cf. subviscida]|uniref:Uncharacterized protein n=1 Tax=Psilocybe cf. subviscida TaxID=2480587 RepID=A0A8H5BQA4_9AGAR|nr:hypothetical protein D9619_005067 [Psilocybe cf. subviscida]